MIERYFDNAATTPIDPRVLREMQPYMELAFEGFGNANSAHSFGQRAAAAVETARHRVATLLGAEDPSQIYFTSGATESNNWVAANFPGGWTSPIEHSSMREAACANGFEVLEARGYELMPPPETASLISVMAVNNETGGLLDYSALRAHARKLHSDATQAIGKVEFELSKLDYASFSGHKFYGPKGIGGLYSREMDLTPLLHGGEQEHGMRSGTLNVPGIVGIGAAAAIATDEMEANRAKAIEMRAAVLEGLKDAADMLVISPENSTPFILMVAFEGVEGAALVLDCDQEGFCVSAGAACSAQSTEPSKVLRALNVEARLLRGAVRISFGRFNQLAEAERLGQVLCRSCEKLRRMV